MARPIANSTETLLDDMDVHEHSLSGVQRAASRVDRGAAPGDRVPLRRHELAPLAPGDRFLPRAVDVAAERPRLPADAEGGELLVTRSPSPDGGHVCTLWFCVRGAGSGYSPDDPAYWAEVLLGPRFPGGG